MIEVLSAGIFTTIQDQGRFGFRNIGVPLSGVMDQYLTFMANNLVANSGDKAVMEMTFSGPILKFHKDTFIAITAGEQVVFLNDKSISLNSVISVKQGDTLKLGSISQGVRGDLAVAGGFDSEMLLNSQSYYQGITQTPKIEKNDLLKFNLENTSKIRNRSVIKLDKQHFENNKIEVYPGPEFELLSNDLKTKLLRKKFIVSAQSNRMAYKFEKTACLSSNEIITSSVHPGTVQLTPSGDLIVLMRDAQTTGGYARIFQLTDKSINQLAQKSSGSEVTFKMVN